MPRLLTNSAGSSGRASASRKSSQAASATRAGPPTGTLRRLLPLPSTWAVASAASTQPAAVAAGGQVQPGQLAHPQAAAVEQLDDGMVARPQRRVVAGRQLLRQGHGIVHAQGLGQRLGRLGRADAVHRVVVHQALAPPMFEQAAPGSQRNGDAARAQAPFAQARRPAADVVGLGLLQRLAVVVGQLLQPAQRVAIHGQRARRQAPLHPQVLQEGRDRRRVLRAQRRPWQRLCRARRAAPIEGVASGAAGRDQAPRRDSAALATSPMRTRNSVPMSAL